MKFNKLYSIASEFLNNREVSPFIQAGGVAASILTSSGKIYSGVCIDTACTLGMCAERNAIANMITHGESHIVKLVCVVEGGEVVMPCGACREYLMQLHAKSGKIEVLENRDTFESTTLEKLIPSWWGAQRFVEDVNCI